MSAPERSAPRNIELDTATFISDALRPGPLQPHWEFPIERQVLASAIPLAAVCIALAEFLFDRSQPRWQGVWFWLALVATVALLVLVQILRFGKSKRVPPAKPDYAATSIIRRREPPDRG